MLKKLKSLPAILVACLFIIPGLALAQVGTNPTTENDYKITNKYLQFSPYQGQRLFLDQVSTDYEVKRILSNNGPQYTIFGIQLDSDNSGMQFANTLEYPYYKFYALQPHAVITFDESSVKLSQEFIHPLTGVEESLVCYGTLHHFSRSDGENYFGATALMQCDTATLELTNFQIVISFDINKVVNSCEDELSKINKLEREIINLKKLNASLAYDNKLLKKNSDSLSASLKSANAKIVKLELEIKNLKKKK